MPYIQLKTNKGISDSQEQALKAAFGRDISLLPGKSEQWLMCQMEGDCRMYFQGSSAPCAMVAVDLFGQPSEGPCGKLTAALTKTVPETLEIPMDRIYARYLGTGLWGWSGSNF